eukprot:1158678-Pelagomonas_calceolata.AAC.3
MLTQIKFAPESTPLCAHLQVEQQRMQELLGFVNHGIVARVLQAMAEGDAQAVGRGCSMMFKAVCIAVKPGSCAFATTSF